MACSEMNVLFCPGLGADRRMFEPIISILNQNNIHPGINFLELRKPLKNKSLTVEEYTEYCLQQTSFENKVFDLAVGCSLGGIILQEALLRRLISAKSLLLISSAHSGKDIHSFLQLSSRLLYAVPLFISPLFQFFLGVLYPVFRFRYRESVSLAKMFLSTPSDLLFLAPLMLIKWNRNLPENQYTDIPDVRIYSIHGTSDPMISFRKVVKRRTVDCPVFNGSHILFITHKKLIAKKIEYLLGQK